MKFNLYLYGLLLTIGLGISNQVQGSLFNENETQQPGNLVQRTEYSEPTYIPHTFAAWGPEWGPVGVKSIYAPYVELDSPFRAAQNNLTEQIDEVTKQMYATNPAKATEIRETAPWKLSRITSWADENAPREYVEKLHDLDKQQIQLNLFRSIYEAGVARAKEEGQQDAADAIATMAQQTGDIIARTVPAENQEAARTALGAVTSQAQASVANIISPDRVAAAVTNEARVLTSPETANLISSATTNPKTLSLYGKFTSTMSNLWNKFPSVEAFSDKVKNMDRTTKALGGLAIVGALGIGAYWLSKAPESETTERGNLARSRARIYAGKVATGVAETGKSIGRKAKGAYRFITRQKGTK